MPLFAQGLALLIIAALLGVVALVVWRLGWIGRTDRPVSTGFAHWLQDMNHMLQPQQPRAEELRQAEEGEDEAEDVGDGRDPTDPPARELSPAVGAESEVQRRRGRGRHLRLVPRSGDGSSESEGQGGRPEPG